MSNTKHTPGPWHYEKMGIGSFLFGGDGNIIAGGEPSEGYMDGSNADERLIAAAPDLLEALQKMLTTWEQGGTDAYPIAEARAAIAKATGEQ